MKLPTLVKVRYTTLFGVESLAKRDVVYEKDTVFLLTKVEQRFHPRINKMCDKYTVVDLSGKMMELDCALNKVEAVFVPLTPTTAETEVVVGVTGHRSLKPFSGRQVYDVVRDQLTILKPSRVITGLAIGFDTVVGIACVDLQIPFTAAVPFDDQPNLWSSAQKKVYYNLLQKADVVWKPTTGVGNQRYFIRNNYIVDNATTVMGFVVPGRSGGSEYTWEYAATKQKTRVNVYDLLPNPNVVQRQ